MMHMSFWFGYDLGDFFFKGLVIDSAGKMIALCSVLTILSILFEAMKVHNAQTKAKAARELRTTAASETNSDSPLLNVEPVNDGGTKACISKTLKGIREGMFFLLQNGLGYALMLSVMLYNGYLFIAVVGGIFIVYFFEKFSKNTFTGMTIGYLLFGHISMKINMENVRAVQSKVVCSSRSADGGKRSL